MIATLRNLGPKSAAMLEKSGLEDLATIRAMGSVAAFFMVREAGFKPSLNLLWALEGALIGQDWKDISKTRRHQLLLELDNRENNHECNGTGAV